MLMDGIWVVNTNKIRILQQTDLTITLEVVTGKEEFFN